MRKTPLFALALLGASAAAPQALSTGAATTRGACSPANTGNNNVFTINCGIGKDQGDQMLRILNKILAGQLDPEAVMAKLDEIGKGIDEIRQNSANRTIGDAAAERIEARIARFKGQHVELHQAANDDEARRFTARIRDILKASGWEVSIGGPIIVTSTDGAPLKGIRIAVADANNEPALTLLNAMNAEGVSIEGNADPNTPADTIRVDVRPKPPRQ